MKKTTMAHLSEEHLSDEHLSDEQIDALLIGDAQATDVAHAAECPKCRARVAQLAGPIEDFTALTLAWGERRSATLAAPMLPAETGWTGRAGWAVAAVALLTAGIMLPAGIKLPAAMSHTTAREASTNVASANGEAADSAVVGRAAEVVQQPAAVASAATLSAAAVTPRRNGNAFHMVAGATPAARDESAELARDNRMLEAIDDEWDRTMPSPAESFGLRQASGANGEAHYAPL